MIQELGTIRYGELRCNFNLSPDFSSFVKDNEMSPDFFIISSQSFYQAILFKLGISHEEKNEVEILFFGINSTEGSVNEKIDDDYIKFESFPLGEVFVSFGARLK